VSSGKFEEAHKGPFSDEIMMSLTAQAKVLRAKNFIQRVEQKTSKVDVRVIATPTNS
jgi:transcriptional regulator with GAF, ATPase, and Fis domain